MINVLMPLMKNVDNLQDHMGNFSREMKSARHQRESKNEKQSSRDEDAFGSLVNSNQLREESVNLKINQCKLYKMKKKSKKIENILSAQDP